MVPKLRKGNEQMRENVTLSVEKHPNNSNLLIYVRMQNKCIYFYGSYLPKATEVCEITPGSYLNISIKKLMITKDNKPTLELVKIKFKDEKSGKSFKDIFQQQKWMLILQIFNFNLMRKLWKKSYHGIFLTTRERFWRLF